MSVHLIHKAREEGREEGRRESQERIEQLIAKIQELETVIERLETQPDNWTDWHPSHLPVPNKETK